MKTKIIISGVVSVAFIIAITPTVQAATTADSELTQQISAGTISTDIRNSSNSVVASPSFGLSAATVSTSQQTVTGTFGDNNQRITVDNPGGANNGWTLAIAATDGATAEWVSGTDSYAFNGATAADGQLTLNPSVGTLTPTAPSTATGITTGTQAIFSAATPITLLTAGSTSDDVWNGYLTGVGVSQTIPASQPVGTYTFNLTQTVTAQ